MKTTTIIEILKKLSMMAIKLYGVYLIFHSMEHYLELLEHLMESEVPIGLPHVSEMYLLIIEHSPQDNKKWGWIAKLIKKFPIINLITYAAILFVFNWTATHGLLHGFHKVAFEGMYIHFEHNPKHYFDFGKKILSKIVTNPLISWIWKR